MNQAYLWINLASVALPFAASFERKRVHYRGYWPALLPALLITAVVFLVWDQWFTAMGVWGFNERYLLEFRLGDLPLGEILFFLCIPYASIFLYAIMNRFWPEARWWTRSWRGIAVAVLLYCAFLLFTFPGHWYTQVTASFTAILLLLQLLWVRGEYMGRFWRFYLVHLIPFFVVNGILTGSWIPEQVVWYDDAENMGIRLGTIPADDLLYSMALMLMNVTLMEAFLARRKRMS